MSLSRRRFLKANGAVLTLPFLHSIAGANEINQKGKPSKKLVIMYIPNGIVRRCFFPGEEEAEGVLHGVPFLREVALGKEVRLVKGYLDNAPEVAEGEVVLFENVRFNAGEKKDDEALSKKYAALCDVFVMDAFGTAHRAQASTHGAGKFAPVACAGLLLAVRADLHVEPAAGGSDLAEASGLVAADARRLDHYPEIEEAAENCRFRDCRHEAEPGCAVIAEIEAGRLDVDGIHRLRQVEGDHQRRPVLGERGHLPLPGRPGGRQRADRLDRGRHGRDRRKAQREGDEPGPDFAERPGAFPLDQLGRQVGQDVSEQIRGDDHFEPARLADVRVLVSNDSGAMHMGQASGAPVVGLFGIVFMLLLLFSSMPIGPVMALVGF